jgi:hypothetical protein
MRKTIMMTGTILIVAVILISGAVAAWVYVDRLYSSYNCTDPDEALGVDDGIHASLGQVGPPPVWGWMFLELNISDVMPNSQDFTVYAESSIEETYLVSVSETPDPDEATYVGTGYDTDDEIFTTPSTGGGAWRYILIEAETSSTVWDPAPGAEIDAVGWDK